MRNKKALILLFVANGVSGFAQGISMLAVPWYYAQQQNSSHFNLMYAGITFLTIFWGLYAGALVDRFNRKKVFLGTNIVECIILLSIGSFGVINGALPTIMVVTVFTITLFGYHIHYPNLYAFTQEVTESKYYMKVTSYIEIVGQVTNLTAGALGALLLEGIVFERSFFIFGREVPILFELQKWELHEIFLMDGITYVLAIFLISLIRYKPYKILEVETGPFKERLKTGLRYLKKNRVILSFGIFSYAIFVTIMVALHALMPMYVSNHLEKGGGIFGLLEVLYASGALLAGVFAQKFFRKKPIPFAVVMMLFATSFTFIMSAFTRSVAIFFLLGFVIGFTNAGTRVMRVSYLLSLVPNNIIGRVNGVFNVTNVLMRVGFIFLFTHHFFSEGSNVAYGNAILGIFTLLSGLIILMNYKKLVDLTKNNIS
ncbi:MFS transporter [Xanthovirga aplysinae]|uniref:MFS transporter n=1 Tax=Xanthovirga aplysinae TaxID=2529853 RepID=UPI0012BC5CEE|nr:MFS transporter [Xanthovirga aplysinae]MTI31717.1 MFS transporter [Xanthovirga aplysinae]